MQIPLINEPLFCKYFVRLSVSKATKGFAVYGFFHPCFSLKIKYLFFFASQLRLIPDKEFLQRFLNDFLMIDSK